MMLTRSFCLSTLIVTVMIAGGPKFAPPSRLGNAHVRVQRHDYIRTSTNGQIKLHVHPGSYYTSASLTSTQEFRFYCSHKTVNVKRGTTRVSLYCSIP